MFRDEAVNGSALFERTVRHRDELPHGRGKKKIKMEDTKYLPELLAEKDSLDSSFTHAMKLISAGKGSCSRG